MQFGVFIRKRDYGADTHGGKTTPEHSEMTPCTRICWTDLPGKEW